MKFTVTNGWNETENCTGILAFIQAGSRICFEDNALQKAYDTVFAADDMTAAAGKVSILRLPAGGRFVTLLIAGIENAKDLSSAAGEFRSLSGRAGTLMKEMDIRSLYLAPTRILSSASDEELASVLYAVFSTLPLCEYSFDRYYSAKSGYRDVQVYAGINAGMNAGMPQTDSARKALAEKALEEGCLLAESICIARDLVNDQAASLTPVEMARKALELGQKYGFETEILDRARCEELGMGLFLAVAKGSALEPAFIIMRYKGGPEGAAPLGFVGKGITYDSGGYHIKTSGMESMYMDMNGGAGVIGAMCAIAGQKLPVNVTAVVAACENMVSANAYRNGDILTSMNGKTVYVQNTDAEGRLTMADAITFLVRHEKPSEIIEMAGLTGSVCNFYGDVCAAALPTHHWLYEKIASLYGITGELYACMPEFEQYKDLLKSPYADITNAPQSSPGIGAAQFLCSFSEDVPMISIDTGKMPFNSRVYDGHPAGATGFGVQTLYWYAKKRADG